MTEIQFYHLLSTPLERALPKLMEKVLASDLRAVIRTRDAQQMQALDAALWTVDAASFIPHGTPDDSCPEAQPVFLTTADDNPNDASVLVLTGAQQVASPGSYAKLLDLFDGHDETALQAARQRWKAYKDAGFALNYIQQQPGGGWKSMKKENA